MAESAVRFVTLEEKYIQPAADMIRGAFPDMPDEDNFTEPDFYEMLEIFPEGTFIALDGDKVVGVATGIFVDIDLDELPRREDSLTRTNGRTNHRDEGDYYYAVDIVVDEKCRGLGIGRSLYDLRKALVVSRAKKGIVAAGVIPGYSKFLKEFGPTEYVRKVVAGELQDPTLSAQLANGFGVESVRKDFFEDPETDSCCTIIHWRNPDYVQPPRPRGNKSSVDLTNSNRVVRLTEASVRLTN